MKKALEAVNMACVVESRHDVWELKVERGDLQQDGVVYMGMARRVTLTNSQTKEEFVELFKGSSCQDKAEKWFEAKTHGAFGSSAETRWMWL